MSCIYAELTNKNMEGKQYNSVSIYSDTKLTLDQNLKIGMNPKTINLIEQFGIIKSMNVKDKLNISFAGNNICKVVPFLDSLKENTFIDIDEIINEAFILNKTNIEDLEFIITYVDDKDIPHIVCIKNGIIEKNCQTAFIGSEIARQKHIEIKNEYLKRNNRILSNLILQDLLNCHVDDSVGGILILNSYSFFDKKFVYPSMFYSCVESINYVKANTPIPLCEDLSKGGYVISQYENINGELVLDFNLANFSILYTSNHRYVLKNENGKYNNENDIFKHIMLPIIFDTKTGHLL